MSKPTDIKLFRTKALLEVSGIGRETLRFYEKRGLIKPATRSESSGYRFYSQETIDRIKFIKAAQESGFSLREIQGLFDLSSQKPLGRPTLERIAKDKVLSIELKIKALQSIRDLLASYVENPLSWEQDPECSALLGVLK